MLAPLGGMLSPLAVSATQTPLLLDKVTGAAAAYSLRKLRNAYAGSAVRLRRSSDNAEQDIGFSDGGFDVSAAASFIGGGSGYCAKWYDQSGNGHDAIQATAGAQPLYKASSHNGKPGLYFDGGDYMATTGGTFLVAWVAAVWKSNNNYYSSYGATLGVTPDANRSMVFSAGATVFYNDPVVVGVAHNTTTLSSPYSIATLATTMLMEVSVANPLVSRNYLLADSVGGYTTVMEYNEMVCYASVQTGTPLGTFRTDVNTYWAIY